MPVYTQPLPLLNLFSYGMIDVPGVVAANNFLSIFNPPGSGTIHVPIELGMSSYAAAGVAVAVGASMATYRTTAASGGTLVAASDIVKFQTSSVPAVSVVRTGNPTVTRVNSTPVGFKSPIVTDKVGNSGTVVVSTPVFSLTGFALFPGEGIVFSTAAGAVAQLWSIVYAWGELPA